MNYLSVDNISKAFSDKLLFENISFGIEKGEKTALIAANGTGKSTMMRILVGKEEADGGKVTFNENVRIGYLEQLPQFDPNLTIEDVISTGHTDVMRVIKRYEEALVNQVDLDKATAAMDAIQAWSYDLRLKQLLSTFEINDLSQKIGTLSGGQVKRLALDLVLLDDPDMLFLATHPDKVCPTENGPIPDVGSMLALYKVATGRSPQCIFGKPDPNILRPLLEKYARKDMVMAGDRLSTDKKLAENSGIDFILVLSGEATLEEALKESIQPTVIAADLGRAWEE